MDNNDAYENEHQARGRALLDQLPGKLTSGMLIGLLDRGPERAQNFARGIATGQLAVVEAVAHA